MSVAEPSKLMLKFGTVVLGALLRPFNPTFSPNTQPPNLFTIRLDEESAQNIEADNREKDIDEHIRNLLALIQDLRAA